jgi:hypothetical protein
VNEATTFATAASTLALNRATIEDGGGLRRRARTSLDEHSVKNGMVDVDSNDE